MKKIIFGVVALGFLFTFSTQVQSTNDHSMDSQPPNGIVINNFR